MGKLKKRFNQKARQVTGTINRSKENDALEKLIVDIPSSELEKFDQSNPLVTSSTKKKTKVKNLSQAKTKILSNKQKKKLEKVLELKKKKEKRSELLESLAKHQVSQEELSSYKSSTQLGNTKLPSKRKTIQQSIDYNAGKRKRNRKRRSKTETGTKEIEAVPNQLSSSSDEESDDQADDGRADDGKADDGKVDDGKVDDGKADDDQADEDKAADYEADDSKADDETRQFSIDQGISENTRENNTEEPKPVIRKDMTTKEDIEEKKKKRYKNNAEAKKENVNKECETIPQNKQNAKKEKPKNDRPIYQQIKRDPEIQTARMLLPIIAEEQVIMETINENDVTIICGSTGSGKTTQIPQFLYEAGYGTHETRVGKIGITEPRRVAAVSMSKRVAEEMSMHARKISYQIRYEGNTTDETIMKFMTDGVLLKEIEADFLLTKYSCIIIDEAHERSVYTDILIGLLSRIVPLRKKKDIPLKLIIMSATLRIEDFRDNKRLFPNPPPVISVDGRQYPVTIHFNKRTLDDYVTEAYKKVCKIHRTLKVDGAILVFLTGQNEVLALCRKLSKTFPKSTTKNPLSKSKATTAGKKNKKLKTDEIAESEEQEQSRVKSERKSVLPKINLDSYSLDVDHINIDDENKDEIDELPLSDNELQDGSISSEDDEEEDILNEMGEFASAVDQGSPIHVLPLYSLLSTRKQQEVFRPPPEGCRLCVIATNVAETSLTIPGIKYIVDCGRAKRKLYDKLTGVSTFKITWTSKASANQRAGRAGRVGPGHCYRLYSSAVFQNDFEEFSEPEILRKPVEDLVLQMKNLCIDKVTKFPFPTVPEVASIQAAETLLLRLGALRKQVSKKGVETTTITSLGKKLCKLPISPRFSKMILLGVQYTDCLQYIIAIVAALTVKEIFTDDIDISKCIEDEKDLKNKRILITRARRKWIGEGVASLLGDLMVVLRAVGACEYTGCSEDFCKSNGLRYKAMVEIRKLRKQLTNTVSGIYGDNEDVIVDPKMKPPDDKQATIVRKIVLSCFGDHVARRIPPEESKEKNLKNAYMSCLTDQPVYIHPTSSLFTKLPDFLVFHEMIETKKMYMKACVCMEEDWLPVYSAYMCTLSKPLEYPPPCFEDGKVKCFRSSSFGPHVWQISPRYLESNDWPRRFRWFARFLLEGEMFSDLREFVELLLTPGSVMVKSWSHLQPKTEGMLSALHKHNIDSKEKLLKHWIDKDPKYLLKEYLQWIPESRHDNVRQMWPPSPM